MSEEEKGRNKVPSFDGRAENYDRWEIKWGAFAEAEGLSDALGEAIDPNMPDSSASVIGKDATGKLQAAAVKTNKKAMAYLALAFDNMKLLRLIIKAKTEEWPEGEAWKVMQFLAKKYRPDDLQARVELRKRLLNLKLRFDQDPSDLFDELAAIQHASAKTKAKVTEIDLIGAVYAAAPMEYIAVLTMEESIRGEDLELEHLEEVMCKMWRHSGGKPGMKPPVKTEIVLNAFTGYCYRCKEKGHRATHCPSKEEKKSDAGSTGRRFNGNCDQCGRQGHKKSECWDMPENEDKRPAGYKPKNEYGHAAISSGSGIEFVLCALGGEQVGGKENAKLYEDEVPTGEDLVDYVGYLGHVEDLIVSEPIEVVEEPVKKVVKGKVDLNPSIQESNEEDHWMLVATAKQSAKGTKLKEKEEGKQGQWVLVANQSGRESKAIMRKAAKKKKKVKNVGCARVQSHNGRVSGTI